MELKVTGFSKHERNRTNSSVRQLTGRSTAYISVEGESIWDDFANRTSRPSRALHPVVLAALKAHGVNVTKMAWNPRAGCSCPCSPGFSISGDTGKDYWITIQATAPATENPEEAAFRMAQLVADPTMPVS